MKKQQRHTSYLDLLLKKHVMQDITAAQEKKLDTHLKKCAACQKEEQILLLKQRALNEAPQLEPSKKFEKNLFAKLNIPVAKEATTDKIIRVVFGQSSRLRFAAAALPIFFVATLLFRGYITPKLSSQGIIADRKTAISVTDIRGKKTGFIGGNKSKTHTAISSYLRSNRLAPTAMHVEINKKNEIIPTKEKRTIVSKTRIAKKATSGASYKYGMAKKRMRKFGNSRMANKNAALGSLNLNNYKSTPLATNQSNLKKTDKNAHSKKIDTLKKDGEKTLKDNTQLSKTKQLRETKNVNEQRGNDNIDKNKTQEKRVIKAQKLKRAQRIVVQQRLITPRKEKERITAPGLKYKTNTITTAKVTLYTANKEELKQHMAPIRAIIKRGITGKSRITVRVEETAQKAEQPKIKKAGKPARNCLLLIWLVIELLVRALLILDLKKREAHPLKWAAAILFGTIFLPFYIFLRRGNK